MPTPRTQRRRELSSRNTFYKLSESVVDIIDTSYPTEVDTGGQINIEHGILCTGPGVFDIDHCTLSIWDPSLDGATVTHEARFDGAIIGKENTCWPQGSHNWLVNYQHTAPSTDGYYDLTLIVKRQSDGEVVAAFEDTIKVGNPDAQEDCSPGECPSGFECNTDTGECVYIGDGGCTYGDCPPGEECNIDTGECEPTNGNGPGLPDPPDACGWFPSVFGGVTPCFLDKCEECTDLELVAWGLLLLVAVSTVSDTVSDLHPVL